MYPIVFPIISPNKDECYSSMLQHSYGPLCIVHSIVHPPIHPSIDPFVSNSLAQHLVRHSGRGRHVQGALGLLPKQSHSRSATEVRRPLTVKQAGL